MADLLYDLLRPAGRGQSPTPNAEPVALEYLTSLASSPLSAIESEQPQALAQTSHSLLLSLQALSKRSHKSIIESASNHADLRTALPALATSTSDLKSGILKLDNEAVRFSTTYHKSGENEMLNSRKRALLLSRNVERLVDVLELPTLLSSAITTGSSSAAANYTPALISMDTSGGCTPCIQSPIWSSQFRRRRKSWLRRVIPELDPASATGNGGGLGALFLVCRLATLMNMLAALEPLRDLADQEKTRQQQASTGSAWSGGQQTERYLKRYIEIFREQSFAIVSMFRSIFPASNPQSSAGAAKEDELDPLQPMPSALSTFPFHLVEMLMETLRIYLPNVKDQTSRDSLLTQVLYCAGSLGRLGGDFGVMLASLDVGQEQEEEWVEVVKRHRIMAGRLESIVGSKDNKSNPDIAVKA
ncbi:hypothetical protein PG994_010828 [Apiospora phragmitis]|uniref:Conserved oligomeric Golgi complex subunit 8 n=1 Tax=Apiospora phragmitis TaxID=2905665 RepID=A0ABR1TTR4_9PEZI